MILYKYTQSVQFLLVVHFKGPNYKRHYFKDVSYWKVVSRLGKPIGKNQHLSHFYQ